MAYVLRAPELLKAFSKALLKAKWGERSMVSCKLSGVRSLVLEVRLWSGKDVSVIFFFLPKNVIICPDKKEQGPKV